MTPHRSPIVLLPGWGFTPAVWDQLVVALTQRGIQRDDLLTPALPLGSHLTLAQRLQDLLMHLPASMHLVGWSLGGELALALAQSCQERCVSMTLISSTPCFSHRHDWPAGQPTALLDDFDQRLAADPLALLKRFAKLICHGDREASRNQALGEAIAAMQDADQTRLSTGLQLLRELDLRAGVPAIRTPTLLIHGAHDAVVPLTATAWLEQTLDQPTCLKIEGASHALPLTHCNDIADAVVAAIGIKP